MHRYYLVLQMLFFSLLSQAQEFQNVAPSFGINSLSQTNFWGNGVSFYDVDEDGWDDITICNSQTPTLYFHNTHMGFEVGYVFYNAGDSKSCLWFDMEEDGDNDLLVTRSDLSAQLFRNDGSIGFTDVSSNLNYNFSADRVPWGASVVDLNRDGYLDLFICNYGTAGAKNTYLQNNGLGYFTENSSLAISSLVKFSFQSTWIDLNEDGFQDLYVINDHNQGNEYFESSGESGTFIDKSVQTGLNAPSSAMSNSWCDYDRDGDWDIYISNTIVGNRLLRNNGTNQFTDIATQEGVVLNKWSWSALWFDRENDGWEDLLVATDNLVYTEPQNNYFFKNFGGHLLPETCSGLSLTDYEAFVYAKGDINNDLLTDIFVNPNTGESVRLLQNTNSITNHAVKFHFKGRWSNNNAVGVKYKFWSGGVKRLGQVLSGENYLAQNSQNFIHGLGTSAIVDSLQIYWPSGILDRYYNLQADTNYRFVEGASFGDFSFSKPHLCPGEDSLVASYNYNWNEHTWDNSSLDLNKLVTSPGLVSATVGAQYGKLQQIQAEITSYALPIVSINAIQPSCKHASNGVVSIAYAADSLSNYSIAFNDFQAEAGTYTYEIPFGIGCLVADSVVLLEPDQISYVAEVTPPLCYGDLSGSLNIQLSGGTLPYLGLESSALVIDGLNGGDVQGVIVDANGCVLQWSASIPTPEVLTLTVTAPEWYCSNETPVAQVSADGGVGDYTWTGLGTDGSLNFGWNTIQVSDANGCARDTSVFVAALAAPFVITDVIPVTASGLGEISLALQGIYGPYSIEWSTGDTTFNLTNLAEGVFYYVITDTNACQFQGQLEVIYDAVNEFDTNQLSWVVTPEGIRYNGNTLLNQVLIYDESARLIHTELNVFNGKSIPLPAAGVYIALGNSKAQRLYWKGRGN